MPVTSADLTAAIVTAWLAAGLDNFFTGYWPEGEDEEFIALNDEMATPDQPFPYCVFRQAEGNTTARMSGAAAAGRYEIRDIPFEFKVFARTNGVKAGKDLAADLAAEILKVYGGHPTESPEPLVLENGTALIAQYQNDMSVRMGDDEYAWIINYTFRLDVPVAA